MFTHIQSSGKIIVLYITLFTFLMTNEKKKRPGLYIDLLSKQIYITNLMKVRKQNRKTAVSDSKFILVPHINSSVTQYKHEVVEYDQEETYICNYSSTYKIKRYICILNSAHKTHFSQYNFIPRNYRHKITNHTYICDANSFLIALLWVWYTNYNISTIKLMICMNLRVTCQLMSLRYYGPRTCMRMSTGSPRHNRLLNGLSNQLPIQLAN